MLGGPYRKTLAASTKANHMAALDWKSPFTALFCAAAGAAAAILAGCSPSVVSTDPALAAFMQRFSQSEMSRLPEEADELGLSVEAFGRRYQPLLDDRSMAVTERVRADRLNLLHELELIDRSALSRDSQRTFDTALIVLRNTVAVAAHGHGVSGIGHETRNISEKLGFGRGASVVVEEIKHPLVVPGIVGQHIEARSAEMRRSTTV